MISCCNLYWSLLMLTQLRPPHSAAPRALNFFDLPKRRSRTHDLPISGNPVASGNVILSDYKSFKSAKPSSESLNYI